MWQRGLYRDQKNMGFRSHTGHFVVSGRIKILQILAHVSGNRIVGPVCSHLVVSLERPCISDHGTALVDTHRGKNDSASFNQNRPPKIFFLMKEAKNVIPDSEPIPDSDAELGLSKKDQKNWSTNGL